MRVRRFYFSEKLDNPDDPTSAVEFYLTEEGKQPKMFDMTASEPDVVAQQGTVEDWIIENRSRELYMTFTFTNSIFYCLITWAGPSAKTFCAIQ